MKYEACKGCIDQLPDESCAGNFLRIDLEMGIVYCAGWESIPQKLSSAEVLAELYKEIVKLQKKVEELQVQIKSKKRS